MIVVKEGEEESKAMQSIGFDSLENTLLAKVQTIQKKIGEEEDPEELQKLNTVLCGLLENLDKIRKTRKT